jgi:hypothetical protein
MQDPHGSFGVGFLGDVKGSQAQGGGFIRFTTQSQGCCSPRTEEAAIPAGQSSRVKYLAKQGGSLGRLARFGVAGSSTQPERVSGEGAAGPVVCWVIGSFGE